MPKPDFLKKLAEELAGAFPGHLHAVKKDVEANFHRVLKNFFASLNIVTREEFDAQVKVLARTRKKLEELEQLVQAKEKKKHNHEHR